MIRGTHVVTSLLLLCNLSTSGIIRKCDDQYNNNDDDDELMLLICYCKAFTVI